MPTICELKEELKSLGVKGYSGKNKAELMVMLEQAKSPKVVSRSIPLKDIMKKKPTKKEVEDFVKSELVR